MRKLGELEKGKCWKEESAGKREVLERGKCWKEGSAGKREGRSEYTLPMAELVRGHRIQGSCRKCYCLATLGTGERLR
jgi:hypothetical protein